MNWKIEFTFSKIMALVVFIISALIAYFLKSEYVFIAGLAATTAILGVKQIANFKNPK